MRVVLVYESLFGSTRDVAEAVTAGVRTSLPHAVVDCLPVAQAPVGAVDAEVLVVGGPTHFLRMTSAATRAAEDFVERRGGRWGRARRSHRTADTADLRGWLSSLHVTPGGVAAAFDTRMGRWASGGASREIARRLQQVGYPLLLPPESFVVDGIVGPLLPGERERATAWGRTVAAAVLDTGGTPTRRSRRTRRLSFRHPGRPG